MGKHWELYSRGVVVYVLCDRILIIGNLAFEGLPCVSGRRLVGYMSSLCIGRVVVAVLVMHEVLWKTGCWGRDRARFSMCRATPPLT